MTSSLRFGAFGLILLGAGFALGRFTSPSEPTARDTLSSSVSTDRASATRPSTTVAPLGAETAQSSTARSNDPISARLKTLEWLLAKKLIGGIPITDHSGDISPQFIDAYGLTPTQAERLRQDLAQTKTELSALATKSATADFNHEAKLLTVSIPSATPEQSGPFYDRLLDSFRTVLGPERFAQFNTLSGERFERTFNHFGLNPISYEISLTPKLMRDGVAQFDYKRSYADADGSSSGTTSGTVTLETLIKKEPAIARFIQQEHLNP
jgi:hypothetical protein